MRCYNGCPDDELQALINKSDALEKAVRTIEPTAHCTYFPVEETFHVHAYGRPISLYHKSRIAALEYALGKLTKS